MPDPQVERRRFPRIKLRTPLRFVVRGTPEYSSVVSDDVGIGGISFINEKFIPRKTHLMLEMNVLSRVLNPVGKVISAIPLPHSNRYRLGVEFVDLNPKEKNYLSDYINMQLSQS